MGSARSAEHRFDVVQTVMEMEKKSPLKLNVWLTRFSIANEASFVLVACVQHFELLQCVSVSLSLRPQFPYWLTIVELSLIITV